MNSEWFEKVIKEQIKTCEDVLIGKAKEYATDDDRLHNFKNAAGMMSCDSKEALAGMMAKHTISVYDMCRSGKDYPIELWNEKITDHINYLLLLKAIVEEEKSPVGKNREYSFTDFLKDIWPNYRSQLSNIKDTTCEPEEEPSFTLAYGEVPTFNGKPVENKNDGEKIVKELKRMAENSTYGLMETKRDIESKPKTIKLPDGKIPTFDGKPVEIKTQDEKCINKIIESLRICADESFRCMDCSYFDENDANCCCSDKLKNDAIELLEKYKSIIEGSLNKGKDDAPKIKEDPKVLDKAIHSFREKIEHCGNAECRECDYYLDKIHWHKCGKSLLDEFDNIMARLKEEHHDNT